MANLTDHARHWFGLAAALLFLSSGSTWGASWREINSGFPSVVPGASGLAIDPATPSTLYSWGSSGALFKSTDGAATWKIANGIAGVSWLGVHPKNSSIIYAGTSYVLSGARMEEQAGRRSRGLRSWGGGQGSWLLIP